MERTWKADYEKFARTARENVAATLDNMDYPALERAAELILAAKAEGKRLHISGIGKPAHLAGYAASLFSSTGTPAYFLHGTEAVHGSCGQLVPGDVVIFISNSGETARIAVKGGNFDTNGAGNFANGAGARIAVSGGIFTEEVLGEYCAAGYKPQTLAEGNRYSATPSAYDDRFGETLTVVGQAAVTEGGTQYYPIDVVCGIDALNYTAVGIEYRVIRTGASPLDTTDKSEVRTVYTTLHLTIDGRQSTCKPADLGASYLYTARLLFDTAAYTEENTVIRITPYAIGMDGTEYRGRTIELDGDVCADNGTTLFAKGE